MKKNNNQRKVKIISEIHPQHLGSIDEAKRMILYSKLGGADFVKVQLYDSKLLFNNNLRSYIQLSKKEFFDLNSYSNHIGIEFFASILISILFISFVFKICFSKSSKIISSLRLFFFVINEAILNFFSLLLSFLFL